MKKNILVSYLVVCAILLSIGCKKKDDATPEPDPQINPPIPTQSIAGAISLPAGCPLSATQLKIYTPLSSASISSSKTFEVKSITNQKPQIITLTNPAGKPVMLCPVLPGQSTGVQIDAISTAKALVLMNPFFVYTDNEQRLTILDAMVQYPAFSSLVENITTLLKEDPDNTLDYSIHPKLFEQAAQLTINLLEDLEKTGSIPNSVTSGNVPWVEDASGEDVVFFNPAFVIFGTEIHPNGVTTPLDVFALDARSALVSLRFGWPPVYITQPTETLYKLGNGNFQILMTKGFDFSVMPLSQFFNLNTGHGIATLYNTGKIVLITVDLLIGYAPTVAVTNLHLNLTASTYAIGEMGIDFAKGDALGVFKGFIKLMDVNKEPICYWLWQEASTEAGRLFVGQILNIVKNLSLAIKVINLANKTLPFVYDLIVGDRWISLTVNQENGIITTNTQNFAPLQPDLWSNTVLGTTNQSILFNVSTTDPEGGNISYRIHYGDGTSSTWSPYIPSWQGEAFTHTFADAGMFHVVAEARDEMDASSPLSEFFPIMINPPGVNFLYDFNSDFPGLFPYNPPWYSEQQDPSYLRIESSVFYGSYGNSCGFYDTDPLIGGDPNNSYAVITTDLTCDPIGTLEFSWRVKNASDNFGVRIWENFGSWGSMGYYVMFYNGTISYYGDGGDFIPIQTIQANTWYRMKLVYNTPDQSYDIYIDGVKKVDEAPYYGMPSQLGTLQVVAFSDATCETAFIDEILLTGTTNRGGNNGPIPESALWIKERK